MQKPFVIVVIVNYNDKHNTLECLRSVLESDYENFGVVIVDNGSKDDSVTRIKEHFPRVKIIETSRNLGIGGGFNVGVNYGLAKGCNYLLLLHSDMVLHRAALRELVAVAERDDGIGAVTGRFHDYQTNSPQNLLPTWNPVKGITHHGTYLPEDHVIELSSIDPFCLVRAQVLKQVPIDETYFVGGEEIDWALRTKRKGWKSVYTPHAILWHKVSQTNRRLAKTEPSELLTYIHGRNYVMTCLRYVPPRYRAINLIYLANSFLYWLTRAIIDSMASRRNLISWHILGAIDGIILGLNLSESHRNRALSLVTHPSR